MAKGGIISAVQENSLAQELELVPGDKIVAVNGQELTDIIDLSFALADEEIEMLVEHAEAKSASAPTTAISVSLTRWRLTCVRRCTSKTMITGFRFFTAIS